MENDFRNSNPTVLNLYNIVLPTDLISKIPLNFMREHEFVPIGVKDNILTCAFSEIPSMEVTRSISAITSCPVNIIIAPSSEIQNIIHKLFPETNDILTVHEDQLIPKIEPIRYTNAPLMYPRNNRIDHAKPRYLRNSKVYAKNNRMDVTSQRRPWVRYWARIVDLNINSYILSLVLIFLAPSFTEYLYESKGYPFSFIIISLFVWIFVEAFLLTVFGTTPGKWLMRIELKDSNNQSLTFNKALIRSFSVWFIGCAAALPLISAITCLVQYSNVSSSGITSWDRKGNFKITHGEIGAGRTVIAVVIIFIGSILAALDRAEATRNRSRYRYTKMVSKELIVYNPNRDVSINTLGQRGQPPDYWNSWDSRKSGTE